jgi:Xaa-Pro dipeptidase
MKEELKGRQDRIRSAMVAQGIDAAIITGNVNLIYTCGQVISGYLYLPVKGESVLFVKRPNDMTGDNLHFIRKPEQIADILRQNGIEMPGRLMLEGDELSYQDYCRLAACFPDCEILPCGTMVLHQVRNIKSDYELDIFRKSGLAHTRAYNQIPQLYKPGMTDIDFSIEIEHVMRKEGMLGNIRIFGQSMEIFMGSILTFDNAAKSSPYDFALGGGGADPSLPVGANGSVLNEGHSVMVDIGGNFFGYMCDMSRVFSIGRLPDEAYAAHQACLDVQAGFKKSAVPGAVCEDLYEMAKGIIAKSGFSDYFMGVSQKAGFIGHGIGLELNEQPVFAPRVKMKLEQGMVFALEPKIVLPGIGPVGIENSWIINSDGIEQITLCREDIVIL